MARRKKLNKRVVVFLVVAGLIIAALAGTLIIRKLPKDPKVYYQRAQDAIAKQNYRQAERNLAIAAEASEDPNYYYELGKLQLEILKQPGVPEAERFERQGRMMQCLRTAMRLNPRHLETQQLLVDIFWARARGGGRWQDLVEEADALLKLVPDDHRTLFRRAHAKSRMAENVPGRYAEPAITDFRKAIELKKDESGYWLALIHFYQRVDRTDEAESIFNEAIEANPDDPGLRVAYANHLKRDGREDEAVRQIEQAIVRDPESLVGHLALIQHYRTKDLLDKALEVIEAAKKIDDSRLPIYGQQMAIYKELKRPEKSAEAIRDGLAAIRARLEGKSGREPSEGERRRLADARLAMYYMLADMLLDMVEQGKWEREELLADVRLSLEKLDKESPDSPQRAKVAGRLALAEGKTSEAMELLERAHRGFGGAESETATLLVNLYIPTMPGKAQEIIDRYLRLPLFQHNASLLIAKAVLEMRYRNYERALQLVNRVRVIDPDNEKAQKLKLELETVTGKFAGLPVELELSTRMVEMLRDRAQKLWFDDRKDEAIQLLEEVRSRKPKNRVVIGHLFSMYYEQQDIDSCKALLKDARAIYPDDPIWKTQRELLDEKDPQKRFELRWALAETIADPARRELEKASILQRFGREEEYVKQLRKVKEIEPDSPAVVERLFRYALRKKDWQMAEEAQKRAADMNLDRAEGKVFAARLAIARRQLPEAIEYLQEVWVLQPDSKPNGTMLGECYMMAGQYEKAEDVFRSVVSNDPTYAAAVIGLSKALGVQGKMEEHKQWIERAHRLAPQDSYVDRMWLILQEEKLAPAEEIIRKRERLLKENPDDIQNRYFLARQYLRVEKRDRAEEMLRWIWDNPRADKFRAARLLAGFYADVGRKGDGEKVLVQLVKRMQDKVRAYMLYGQFLERYGPEQARNAYKKAIDIDPKDSRGHLAMAYFLASRRQWAAAAEAMEGYLEIRPEASAQERKLVQYLIEGRQFDAAAKRLDQILAANPSDAEALMLKGVLKKQQDQLDQAQEFLTRSIRENPKMPGALFYRSEVHRAKGDLIQCRRDLQDARKLTDNLEVTMALARVMVDLGDRGSAQLIYKEILANRPNYAAAIHRLLELYLQEKRWMAMESLVAEAKTRFPKDPGYLVIESQMCIQRNRTEEALGALESALEINPKYEPAIRQYLLTLIRAGAYEKASTAAEEFKKEAAFANWATALQARALARQNLEAQADEAFVAALKNASSQELDFVLAQVSAAYGYTRAVQKVLAWIDITRADDWQIRRLVAVLQLAESKPQQAVEILLEALELATTDQAKASVNRSLGVAYYQLQRFAEAEAAYLAALKVFPNDLQVMNNLAYLYVNDKNQPVKALPYAQRAAGLMPSDGNVRDTYGWTLAKAGKLRQAEEELRRSVELLPAFAENRYHLGWVYEQLGRLAEAQDQYLRAFELVRANTDHSLHDTLQQGVDRLSKQLEGKER